MNILISNDFIHYAWANEIHDVPTIIHNNAFSNQLMDMQESKNWHETQVSERIFLMTDLYNLEHF